jgi:hypothetical protein
MNPSRERARDRHTALDDVSRGLAEGLGLAANGGDVSGYENVQSLLQTAMQLSNSI